MKIFNQKSSGGGVVEKDYENIFLSGKSSLEYDLRYRTLKDLLKLTRSESEKLYLIYGFNHKGYEYNMSNYSPNFGIDYSNYLNKSMKLMPNLYMRIDDGSGFYLSKEYDFQTEIFVATPETLKMNNYIGLLSNNSTFVFGVNDGTLYIYDVKDNTDTLQNIVDNMTVVNFNVEPNNLGSRAIIEEGVITENNEVLFPIEENRTSFAKYGITETTYSFISTFNLPSDLFNSPDGHFGTIKGYFYKDGWLYDPVTDERTNISGHLTGQMDFSYFHKDGVDYFSVTNGSNVENGYQFCRVRSIYDVYNLDIMESAIHNFSGSNEYSRDYICSNVRGNDNFELKYKLNNGDFYTLVDMYFPAGYGTPKIFGTNAFNQNVFSKIGALSKRFDDSCYATSNGFAFEIDKDLTDSETFYIYPIDSPSYQKEYYVEL